MRAATAEEQFEQLWMDDTTRVVAQPLSAALRKMVIDVMAASGASRELAQMATGFAAMAVASALIGAAADMPLDRNQQLAGDLAKLARKAVRE